ncbi:MAG: transposase [Verrucomicrobiales bacterium]
MEARFDEPELTSDAGLAALVSSGIADEVIASLAAAMDDPRKNPEHSGEQLLRQRIFQIIGGYYDANDSDQLRDDMVMRTAAGKSLEQGRTGKSADNLPPRRTREHERLAAHGARALR